MLTGSRIARQPWAVGRNPRWDSCDERWISAQGVPDEEDAFGVGHAQLPADGVARKNVAVAINFHADAPAFPLAVQPAGIPTHGHRVQRVQAFLQAARQCSSLRPPFNSAIPQSRSSVSKAYSPTRLHL